MVATKGDCPTCGDKSPHPVQTGTGRPLTKPGVPVQCTNDGTKYIKR